MQRLVVEAVTNEFTIQVRKSNYQLPFLFPIMIPDPM